MTDTKQEILDLLTRQEFTVQELSGRLAMTVAGVRQHLTILEAQGRVSRRKQIDRPNRPTYLYRLSEAGKRALPRRYDLLADELLDAVKARFGEDVSRELIEQSAMRIAAQIPPGSRGIDPQARWREALGWLEREFAWHVVVDDNGEGVTGMTVHQCPFEAVSRRHPEVCPAFFTGLAHALLGRVAVRCDRLPENIACCRVQVGPALSDR
jgi:DeoR family suf operon transcriptional repressor